MIRRYHSFLAVTLSAVMTVLPSAALAAGTQTEEPLTDTVAQVILDSGDADFAENEAAGILVLAEDNAAEADPATEAQPLPEDGVRVVFNGQELVLEQYARLIDGNSYVPVREFFGIMGCTVTWDSAVGCIRIIRDGELEGYLVSGSRLARFNGRCWYMTAACVLADGAAMIPLRDAARIFNAQVTWSADTRTVSLSGYGLLESGETYYNAEDLLWIARIVRHEAGNQPLEGKVAVANVIINRMRSAAFPNTAEEVIFDTRSGVQFVTRSSTAIYKAPSEECWLAAKLALEGYETAPDCLYFSSNAVAKRCWAGRNRAVYAVIGGHTFFL